MDKKIISMKTQGFANILMIILATVLIGGIGYVVLEKSSLVERFGLVGPAIPSPTSSPTTSLTEIMADAILETINKNTVQITKEQVWNGFDMYNRQFKNGVAEGGKDSLGDELPYIGLGSGGSGSYDGLIFADLDGDNLLEALVPGRVVRASSGGELYVFKNFNGIAKIVDTVGFGKQNGKIISIYNNTFVVLIEGVGYPTIKETYKFISGKLVKQAKTEADIELAKEVLVSYFNLLNERQYAEALQYHGSGYEYLQYWNPDMDINDHVGLIKSGCEVNGLNCLKIKTILSQNEISPTEFSFVIQFVNKDGTTFGIGLCCGATEETPEPPKTDFKYTVKKTGTSFLVVDSPRYTP